MGLALTGTSRGDQHGRVEASLDADCAEVTARCASVFAELRGARLLITGASGFVGMWLLETLRHADRAMSLGLRATVLTRDPSRLAARAPWLASDPAFAVVVGDVRDFTLPDQTLTHVLHAAVGAEVPDEPTAALATFDTLVNGTRRVLETARLHGAQHLLFVSSGAVYGRQPASCAALPEDWPGAPDPRAVTSCYGEGKRAAEWLCGAYGLGAIPRVTIARCFAFVGPWLPLDARFAAGNFIRDGLRGGPIAVNGDGTALRTYLYAADLAAWLWTVLLRGRHGGAYNVGGSNAVTVAELADAVAGCWDPRPEVTVAHPAIPGAPPSRYVPDVGLARRELGLEAWTSLDVALARTVAWHRSRSLP